MTKSIIYYTDGKLEDPIYTTVQKYILKAGLPVFASSLFPYRSGEPGFESVDVIGGERSYPTMVKQILSCLKRSMSRYVFFCEHDVLYSKSHFDFKPPRDDIFYYNDNVWRWKFGSDVIMQHDRMIPLAAMCCNRKLVLKHYLLRWQMIEKNGWDKNSKGEPEWVRKMGYEPGTKKKKRGGITDDDFETWSSKIPIIDIRHAKNFTSQKTKLKDFKHQPKWFTEKPLAELEGWDLKSLFNYVQ